MLLLDQLLWLLFLPLLSLLTAGVLVWLSGMLKSTKPPETDSEDYHETKTS